ncbi:MAG: hypothetical protein HDS64_08390 [Bacteroidales bacterium]|nr:hypothetical protein [Bacteroidales bacterium]MBD5364130.1 hypothetical protein [Bacteroides sp.]MBD5373198.1 hypothetical protein [Bacteroides sp.]
MNACKLLTIFITLSVLTGLTGCYDSVEVDFRRVPLNPVYVPFTTAGEWDLYAAKAPLDAQRFIIPSTPAGFSYTSLSATGFGGILMTCDMTNTPRAYDLSCPVECQRDILVIIDRETNLARCPRCGSTYDVFLLNGSPQMAGAPTSGEAMTRGLGLRRYSVTFGLDGRYALIVP